MYIHRGHLAHRRHIVMRALRHRNDWDSIVEALAAHTLGGGGVLVSRCGGPGAQSDIANDNGDGDCDGDTQDGRCV